MCGVSVCVCVVGSLNPPSTPVGCGGVGISLLLVIAKLDVQYVCNCGLWCVQLQLMLWLSK